MAPSRRRIAALVAALVTGFILISAGSSVVAQRGSTAGDQVIMLPQRTSLPPLKVVLPELPPGAGKITPSTMVVAIERRAPSRPPATLRQTITRTAERVHILTMGDGREWLFVRNPVDPRRASGFVVHHDKRTIVRYEDTELRNWMALRGWADVITLGIDVNAVSELQATTGKKSLAGWTFVRFVAREKDHPVREVWWDGDQALPCSFRIVDATGSTTMTVKTIERFVKEDLLRPPAARFPTYRVVDLADWLER